MSNFPVIINRTWRMILLIGAHHKEILYIWFAFSGRKERPTQKIISFTTR
jgi:hypothetical protein